jgi:hypothetical protein
MQIYVGGSLREVPQDADLCRSFVAALGAAVVSRGHVLLNGCRSSLDREIATAAQQWLTDNKGNPKAHIISYRIKGDEPVHSLGTLRYSALPDWGMNHADLEVPEQIRLADVTIFVAGTEGTYWARNWASFARKPILGIPRFGGAADTIYRKELKQYQATHPDVAADYETLNSLSDDVAGFANEVLSLAERLVTPRSVFTIMSFKREYLDVFASCQEVCREFQFEAERTDHSTSLERIVPRIESGIRNSAFVIADVSDLTPNVFYELGFAKGLGKRVIVTAGKARRCRSMSVTSPSSSGRSSRT